MRTARIGLLIGYSFLVVGFGLLFGLVRFGPDLGKFGFAIVASLIVFLCSALALALFGGSLVCATRALYRERDTRNIGGYITLFLSFVSAIGFGAAYIRGFVIGH